jgi:hypothetical protein
LRTTTATGRSPSNFRITWSAQCASGATYGDSSGVGSARVAPFPRFRRSGKYTTTAASYSAAQGRSLSFDVSATLAGKLQQGERAVGTWTGQVRVLDVNQHQIDACNTGAITWKARLQ